MPSNNNRRSTRRQRDNPKVDALAQPPIAQNLPPFLVQIEKELKESSCDHPSRVVSVETKTSGGLFIETMVFHSPPAHDNEPRRWIICADPWDEQRHQQVIFVRATSLAEASQDVMKQMSIMGECEDCGHFTNSERGRQERTRVVVVVVTLSVTEQGSHGMGGGPALR
jgi:hypothetical protein